MPDPYKPSEFGGKVRKNRVQPLPHIPTASEAVMLGYTTGDASGVSDPDGGEAFNGLLPEHIQRELRQQAGDLDKGQVWDEMVQAAEAVDPVEVIG